MKIIKFLPALIGSAVVASFVSPANALTTTWTFSNATVTDSSLGNLGTISGSFQYDYDPGNASGLNGPTTPMYNSNVSVTFTLSSAAQSNTAYKFQGLTPSYNFTTLSVVNNGSEFIFSNPSNPISYSSTFPSTGTTTMGPVYSNIDPTNKTATSTTTNTTNNTSGGAAAGNNSLPELVLNFTPQLTDSIPANTIVGTNNASSAVSGVFILQYIYSTSSTNTNTSSDPFGDTVTNVTITNTNTLTQVQDSISPSSLVLTNGLSTTGVPFEVPGGAAIPTIGSIVLLGAIRKFKKNVNLNSCADNSTN